MKFEIGGITIALVVSMTAFVLSFHACANLNETPSSVPTKHIEDIIETDTLEKNGSDAVEDVEDKTLGSVESYKKVELIVFDIDGAVVHSQIIDNI